MGFTQEEAGLRVGMVVRNEQGGWGTVFSCLRDRTTGEWLVEVEWSIAGGRLSFGSYPKEQYEERFEEVRKREEQVRLL